MMRDRLIELLDQNCGYVEEQKAEKLADHLLANGVIAPHCKVGDTIYRCAFERNEVWEWELVAVKVYTDQVIFIDDSDNVFTEEDIGETVFLTKEEAERALKERDNNAE